MYECRCRLSASLHTETRGRGSGSIATAVAKSYYRLAWKDVQIRSSGKIYMFICFERDVSDANSSNVWTTQKDFSTLFFMVMGVCRELLRFNVFQNCFFFSSLSDGKDFKRTNNFLCCGTKYFLLFSSICSKTDAGSLVLLFDIISQASQSAEIYESSPARCTVRSQWHRVVDRGVAASGEIKSYFTVLRLGVGYFINLNSTRMLIGWSTHHAIK